MEGHKRRRSQAGIFTREVELTSFAGTTSLRYRGPYTHALFVIIDRRTAPSSDGSPDAVTTVVDDENAALFTASLAGGHHHHHHAATRDSSAYVPPATSKAPDAGVTQPLYWRSSCEGCVVGAPPLPVVSAA